jgi:hypothetical protein
MNALIRIRNLFLRSMIYLVVEIKAVFLAFEETIRRESSFAQNAAKHFGCYGCRPVLRACRQASAISFGDLFNEIEMDFKPSHNGTTDSEFVGRGLHYDSETSGAEPHTKGVGRSIVTRSATCSRIPPLYPRLRSRQR